MERVNIDILRISELKWTEMSEFNSDYHYIDNYGQVSLRRNGIVIMVNKIVQNAGMGCNPKKWQDALHSQGKPFNITVIQVYAPIINVEEAEVDWFYDDLQDLNLIPKKENEKDILLHTGD